MSKLNEVASPGYGKTMMLDPNRPKPELKIVAQVVTTPSGFRMKLDEFMNWTSSREKPLSSWFVSLKDWAEMEFNKAYEEENSKE